VWISFNSKAYFRPTVFGGGGTSSNMAAAVVFIKAVINVMDYNEQITNVKCACALTDKSDRDADYFACTSLLDR